MPDNLIDTLFPDDLIPFYDLPKLVSVLLHPYRHKAKGIECITGRYISVPLQGNQLAWFPQQLSEDEIGHIERNLNSLFSLEFPITESQGNQFINDFILLPSSPAWIPILLTNKSLLNDNERREASFNKHLHELKKLLKEKEIHILDASRIRHHHAGPYDSFLPKSMAVEQLKKIALLDKAISYGSTYLEIIREPDNKATEEPLYEDMPKGLREFGKDAYLKLLLINSSVEKKHHEPPKEAKLKEKSYDEKSDKKSNLPEKTNETDRADKSNYKNQNDEDNLMNVADVIKFLNIDSNTLYNYTRKRHPSYDPTFPKPFKIGNRNKWRRSVIEKYIENKLNSDN